MEFSMNSAQNELYSSDRFSMQKAIKKFIEMNSKLGYFSDRKIVMENTSKQISH